MATELVSGPRTLKGQVDEYGHRTYTIVHLVRAGEADGPANVMQTAGLPQPGDVWQVDDDVDLWAFFRKGMNVSIHQEMEGDGRRGSTTWRRLWKVEQQASTVPLRRCQDYRPEDPLLTPPQVSGGQSHSTVEAIVDKDGRLIKNSAHEVVRGPQVEFQKSQQKISVKFNVATWEQVQFCINLIDHVNDEEIWGCPYRSVRLVDVPWEQQYYGACFVYYTVTLAFEVNIRQAVGVVNGTTYVDPTPISGWDRDLADEGTKVLNGEWAETAGGNAKWRLKDVFDPISGGGIPPDPDDPLDFMRATDRQGNPCRIMLNGAGLPAEVTVTSVGTGSPSSQTDPGQIHVEYYPETNFLALGIPDNFDLIGD